MRGNNVEAMFDVVKITVKLPALTMLVDGPLGLYINLALSADDNTKL